MIKKIAGYKEIEHTADWELEVWAPDLPGLILNAAVGMYALVDTKLMSKPITKRTLVMNANDSEELLVSFLSELIYIAEDEGLGFDNLILSIEDNTLTANLSGRPIESQNKEIKAVTYHNLKIIETDKGLEATVVFDV